MPQGRRYSPFNQKVKSLRWRVGKIRAHELTQEELAESVGVTRQTIQNWENNEKTSISVRNLQKLIEVFFGLGAFEEVENEVKELWELAGTGAAFDERWFKIMLGELNRSEKQGPMPEPASANSDTIGNIPSKPEEPRSAQAQATDHLLSRRTLLGWVGSCAVGVLIGGVLGSVITRTALQHSAKWEGTGSMLLPRRYFRATPLPNGQVLIEGGSITRSLDTAESELFNPVTGIWTKTGGMFEERSQHTATLLPNGKVLVTGGFANRTRISAEIYDPATGIWTLTKQSMSIPRARHTATLLDNGKVLIAGGVNIASAELYDPVTDSWSAAGTMAMPRADHIANKMYDGRVLIAGGTTDNSGMSSTNTAEIFDPNVNTWSATSNMNVARAYFTGILLPNGEVFVIGGRKQHTVEDTPTTEIYDPGSGAWSRTDDMQYARHNDLGQEALLLENGLVLVVGGDAIGTCEIYSPTMQSWISVLNLSSPQTDGATALLSKGQALIAGGSDTSGRIIINMAERYFP